MPRPAKLDAAASSEALKTVPGWSITDQGDGIEKRYEFENFAGSLAFVNRVGALAEAMDHHPDITIEYNKVRLYLSTHDQGGLTASDFELARRIDA